MAENIIKTKTFSFALRIVKLSQFLNQEKKEYVLSKQLLRSGTGIGALVREAEGRKESAQLAADADLYVAIKHGEVKKTLADAEAYAIKVISDSIANGGQQAIDFEIKKINAEAIKSIGASSSSKLLLLPSDVVDSFTNAVAKVISR